MKHLQRIAVGCVLLSIIGSFVVLATLMPMVFLGLCVLVTSYLVGRVALD